MAEYLPERLYKASSIQESKTVTDNGTVTPDDGYEAIKEVIVNVPEATVETEEKNVTITSNGSETVTPSEGKYISKVNITTNVASSGGVNTTSSNKICIKYDVTSQSGQTILDYCYINDERFISSSPQIGIYDLPVEIYAGNAWEPLSLTVYKYTSSGRTQVFTHTMATTGKTYTITTDNASYNDVFEITVG